MDGTVILKTRRFEVTTNVVRSANDTYALSDVQHVRLRRPWLLFAISGGGGLMLLATVFWSELFWHERGAVMGATLAAMLVSTRIGRLKLQSIALRDGDGVLWGEIGEIRKVKHAIEAVLTGNSARRAGWHDAAMDEAE